ncbi:hypothetical protein AMTR_s00093p00128290 [Amborella trichopoda]|uniref:Uncharacterized protein n=1 Tax=Amborella trichopoda TaxID=13333 RepID=W1NVX1_AMBTC|nr:hypothetical protein AMTR_s00093p00128290 [Amborella trichopoda]
MTRSGEVLARLASVGERRKGKKRLQPMRCLSPNPIHDVSTSNEETVSEGVQVMETTTPTREGMSSLSSSIRSVSSGPIIGGSPSQTAEVSELLSGAAEESRGNEASNHHEEVAHSEGLSTAGEEECVVVGTLKWRFLLMRMWAVKALAILKGRILKV